MYGNLAHLCAEYESLYTDEVADVEQFLEYHVVHLAERLRRQIAIWVVRFGCRFFSIFG